MIQEQFQVAICPSKLKFILTQKRINKHLQHSYQNPEMWLGPLRTKERQHGLTTANVPCASLSHPSALRVSHPCHVSAASGATLLQSCSLSVETLEPQNSQ